MSNFKPMLAAQYEESRVANQLPVYVQPKFDGIRAILCYGQLLSRSLKPIPNDYIRQTIEAQYNWMKNFDGELIIGEPNTPGVYHRTNSAVMSQGGEPDFRYYVFDIVSMQEQFVNRHAILSQAIMRLRAQGINWVYPVETYLCHTLDEVYAREEQLIRAGYEGAILRRPAAHYKFGRATPKQGQLIKLKRYVDAEAVVVGFDELLHNENAAMKSELGYTVHSTHKENMRPGGKLGALKCRGKYPSGEEFEVDLGTGFTDADRIEIWNNRDKYLGKLAKFKYFAVGVKDKPRHPVFLGWRSEVDL
jgi:DNA ligase-1